MIRTRSGSLTFTPADVADLRTDLAELEERGTSDETLHYYRECLAAITAEPERRAAMVELLTAKRDALQAAVNTYRLAHKQVPEGMLSAEQKKAGREMVSALNDARLWLALVEANTGYQNPTI
ncbi:hypothetical protein GCM10023184_17710 [Flaviaesturariibacter amylovorans]|uniref:Uncharacterized protein n=1 Tax=Flaviaesturariibacter amylovorans TaxID=1084520 RepID=A0ABP8GPP2_9BACT